MNTYPPTFHMLWFEQITPTMHRSHVQARTREGRILHSLPIYAPAEWSNEPHGVLHAKVRELLEIGVIAIKQTYMSTTRGLPA